MLEEEEQQPRASVYVRDPLGRNRISFAGMERRDERRKDYQGPERDRQQTDPGGQADIGLVLFAPIRHLPVHFVVPDQVVDAEGDDGEQRHEPGVANLRFLALGRDRPV